MMAAIRQLIVMAVFLLLMVGGTLEAQIRLPALVSDGMVLQREADVSIWGWAEPGEEIHMEFLDNQYQTTAGPDGAWEFRLSDLNAGGPFEIRFTASDTVTVKDVWIGDVWVGSGQSNMELPMYRVEPLYREDIASVGNPPIRYFEVPKIYDFNSARVDMDGGWWRPVNSETIEGISALAYFFSKKIHETLDVPVGIILSALGGSPAEAWLSEEALLSFPGYYEELQHFKSDDLIEEIESADRKRIQQWYQELNETDRGLAASGTWYQKELDTDGWETMDLPGFWGDTVMGPVHGSVWFRKTIELSELWDGRSAKLELGRIVDADSVFINGTSIGNTTYQYPPRWYQVPEGVLHEGENVIAVRVINESGKGGFVPDKPYELTSGADTLDLKGPWHYKPGAEMEAMQGATAIRWKPGGLYNAMIHPLLTYAIKGVIWYQGETNADRPEDYRELFTALIQDWRDRWNQGDFPFLYVQLANFMEPKTEPGESSWALLREAQLQALELKNTGMAVAIDLGEWNDIHPLNKKDVGERLARSAMKTAYGLEVEHSGPQYESMEIDGSRAILSFRHTGGGLVAKDRTADYTHRGDGRMRKDRTPDYTDDEQITKDHVPDYAHRGDGRMRKGGENGHARLNEFTIAGEDGVFKRAEARIEGEHVVVWHEDVKYPVAVRYAWADNPDQANLYNREGLPTSPFRTDSW